MISVTSLTSHFGKLFNIHWGDLGWSRRGTPQLVKHFLYLWNGHSVSSHVLFPNLIASAESSFTCFLVGMTTGLDHIKDTSEMISPVNFSLPGLPIHSSSFCVKWGILEYIGYFSIQPEMTSAWYICHLQIWNWFCFQTNFVHLLLKWFLCLSWKYSSIPNVSTCPLLIKSYLQMWSLSLSLCFQARFRTYLSHMY